MTTSPIPTQVEAESVDTPEFADLMTVWRSWENSEVEPAVYKDVIAHIDSIITARVAAERERLMTWEKVVDLGMSADWMQRAIKAEAALAASQAAPAKAEGPKLAHGHRSDWHLMANVRRIAQHPISRIRKMPNWALASELFATGSTSGSRICRDAGIDPDGFTVERAAPFTLPEKNP